MGERKGGNDPCDPPTKRSFVRRAWDWLFGARVDYGHKSNTRLQVNNNLQIGIPTKMSEEDYQNTTWDAEGTHYNQISTIGCHNMGGQNPLSLSPSTDAGPVIRGTIKATDKTIDAIYDAWKVVTWSPDPSMNLNQPSATTTVGKVGEMAGSLSPLLGVEGSAIKKTTETNTSLVKTGNQFSKHSLERLAQRGVTQDMAELAIRKGQKFYDPLNKSINYILPKSFASGKNLLVGTNPLTGQVTTVLRSSKNLIKPRMTPIK